MTIQAIETRYAGCRFRSRLEARWAVFFDYAGIRWEYEPQGVLCTWRLSLDDGTFPYLPDFWLPELGLWVEVKGSLTDDECVRLLNAAASLSSNNAGGCHDAGGNDVLVLGSIPTPETDRWDQRLPVRLHMHKGDLNASCWPTSAGCHGVSVARDVGCDIFDCGLSGVEVAHILTAGMVSNPVGWSLSPISWAEFHLALIAARSARFEHGERG